MTGRQEGVFVVTVKVPRNPGHDPANKKAGCCEVDAWCTDRTGAHHSFLTTGSSAAAVQQRFEDYGCHVTRVECAVWRQ